MVFLWTPEAHGEEESVLQTPPSKNAFTEIKSWKNKKYLLPSKKKVKQQSQNMNFKTWIKGNSLKVRVIKEEK